MVGKDSGRGIMITSGRPCRIQLQLEGISLSVLVFVSKGSYFPNINACLSCILNESLSHEVNEMEVK